MKTQETTFACNLTVLSESEREQFASLTDALFAAVQATRELENGFAFRFINRPGQLVQIAQFIERESQCCPFLQFSLEVETSSGPAWLHITGEEGVKPFLLAELDQIQALERS
jgi:hypothetical protein